MSLPELKGKFEINSKKNISTKIRCMKRQRYDKDYSV